MIKFNTLWRWSKINTYLERFPLIKTPWFRVYLHKFLSADANRRPHDHPARFIAIGLWGGYVETQHLFTTSGSGFTESTMMREYDAPFIRSFTPNYIHKIASVRPNTWTLVIVFKPVRVWGFWGINGSFIEHKDYNDG